MVEAAGRRERESRGRKSWQDGSVACGEEVEQAQSPLTRSACALLGIGTAGDKDAWRAFGLILRQGLTV